MSNTEFCTLTSGIYEHAGRLGAGTTRMCAGIVTVAKPLSIECQMANYSNSLYEQLEEETGVKTGQLFAFIHFYLVCMITVFSLKVKLCHVGSPPL